MNAPELELSLDSELAYEVAVAVLLLVLVVPSLADSVLAGGSR